MFDGLYWTNLFSTGRPLRLTFILRQNEHGLSFDAIITAHMPRFVTNSIINHRGQMHIYVHIIEVRGRLNKYCIFNEEYDEKGL